MAVIWLWHVLKEKHMTRKSGICVALLILFWACYIAWLNEYKKTQPGLHLNVYQVAVGADMDVVPPRPFVYMSAAIKNNGEPSIADHWELDIYLPNNPTPHRYSPEIIRSSSPKNMFDMIGGETVVLDESETLYNKTMKEPIKSGMKIVGFLPFIIHDLTVDDANQLGTAAIYVLRCYDINENKIESKYDWHHSHRTHQIKPYPGMNLPLKAPLPQPGNPEQSKESEQKIPPSAEEIAKEVIKKLPKQPNSEARRPSFTAEPKLIMDKLNNVLSLDFKITNVGTSSAMPMFGYSFIFQLHPIPTLLTHPQSWTNEIQVGRSTFVHEPSIKMMELKGNQYAFYYIHYTDVTSKKKYSQAFYFERVIYKNGFIEYSDASTKHKKEMDGIRKGNCKFIEDLVNSGADENTFRAAMKKRGLEVGNITDF
ncbi:MAG: hypothetical protein ABSA71_01620 [Desulfomonilia bacterium]